MDNHGSRKLNLIQRNAVPAGARVRTRILDHFPHLVTEVHLKTPSSSRANSLFRKIKGRKCIKEKPAKYFFTHSRVIHFNLGKLQAPMAEKRGVAGRSKPSINADGRAPPHGAARQLLILQMAAFPPNFSSIYSFREKFPTRRHVDPRNRFLPLFFSSPFPEPKGEKFCTDPHFPQIVPKKRAKRERKGIKCVAFS